MDLLDEDDRLFLGVITGAGGNFSAGADLKEIAKQGVPPSQPRGGFGIMGRPARKPLIAAVEGYAVAGGFETCLSCDLIVAARNAKLGAPEVRPNLLASSALVRLPRRMPCHLAMELVLTGTLKEAAWFGRFGLVNRLAEPGRALADALRLAHELLENGPLALAASKEIMFQSAGQDNNLWVEQTAIAQKVLNSEDLIEGLSAFAEKRKRVARAGSIRKVPGKLRTMPVARTRNKGLEEPRDLSSHESTAGGHRTKPSGEISVLVGGCERRGGLVRRLALLHPLQGTGWCQDNSPGRSLFRASSRSRVHWRCRLSLSLREAGYNGLLGEDISQAMIITFGLAPPP